MWESEWAWVPVLVVYWCTLGALIAWGREPDALRRWLAHARGPRLWTVLAVIVGLIPLPILILNFHLLSQAVVFVAWLLFAMINPWLEEGYWRGLMLDATRHWPRWASNLYSTSLFTLNHPLLGGTLRRREPRLDVIAGVIMDKMAERIIPNIAGMKNPHP